MRSLFAALVLVLVVGVSGVASAQAFPEQYETGRGLAMGFGGRASAYSTSALAYNPANLSATRVYHIEATTGYSPSANVLSFGSAVVDSVTSRLAMGMAVRGLLGVGDSGYGGFDGRLVLAMNLVDSLSIGVAARYARLEYQGTPPPGQADVFLNNFTMDASIRLTPWEGLNLAVIAQNLIPTDSPFSPLFFGGSISYTFDNVFTLNVDGLVDLSPKAVGTPFTIGGAMELLAGGVVPLRAGYYYDDTYEAHVVTGGLGYIDTKMGIDFSLRQQIEPTASTTMIVGIRYFVR